MSDAHERLDHAPDVGAMLEALRAEVRARRMARGRGEASPAERELQRALDEIELYRVISAHWPLLGHTLPQRAVALVNKLVRRYLRWYINPIVEQQNAYNDAVARALRLLAEAYIELGEQITGGLAEERRNSGSGERNGEAESGVGSLLSVADDHGPQTTDYRQARGLPAADHGPRTTDYGPTGNPHYAELMAIVQARAAAEPPARFPDLNLRALEPQLRLRQQVSAHWPLLGHTLPQRAVALANKLVRRYLRWYINPIVEQQNAANAAFTVALLRLMALDGERRAEVAALRAHQIGERSQ